MTSSVGIGSTVSFGIWVGDPSTVLPHDLLSGSATKALESADSTVPFTVGLPDESEQMKMGSLEKMLPLRVSPETKSTG